MARGKRRPYVPKYLYAACKCWRDEEAKYLGEPPTLAQVWSKATKEDSMGNAARFRKYVLREYELELRELGLAVL